MKKAVALKYPQGAEAPYVIAKGQGLLANIIIDQAQKNDVHIEENTPLVNFLSQLQTGSLVPPESWEILAQVFAVILEEEK